MAYDLVVERAADCDAETWEQVRRAVVRSAGDNIEVYALDRVDRFGVSIRQHIRKEELGALLAVLSESAASRCTVVDLQGPEAPRPCEVAALYARVVGRD